MDTESFIPVEDEPLHKQRWKSDIVRLVCAQIPPNTTSLWHQHLKSGVYVCVGDLEGIEEARGADPKHLNVASGNVFCRDHTEDKLVHVITSHEKPIYMIEVELLKEKHQIKPNESTPVLEHAAVQCIEAKRECRVYRVNLAPHSVPSKLSLELSTDAVLVVLTECVVRIVNKSESPSESQHVDQVMRLTPGDDVVLKAGTFVMRLEAEQSTEARFILVEVF